MNFKRVVLIVLDSVGVGKAPDAHKFGDQGSHTLGNIRKWCQKHNKKFSLPCLEKLGLDSILGSQTKSSQLAFTARLEELSLGKDTTTGHWELTGQILTEAFPTFPQGFSVELLATWCQQNQLAGVLANSPASGTEVIKKFGLEHIRSLKPIVYTSADSVFQVAAHEQHFGLTKLYKVCQSARELLNPVGVSRVIARPFTGDTPDNFSRTANRRDYSLQPMSGNLLDILVEHNCFVASVGKISDIFAGRSITHAKKSTDNAHGLENILAFMQELSSQRGLIFANLIDFDQHFGHRRDPAGYADCLMDFDRRLPHLLENLDSETLLLITADHGNDPTFKGSDHTREQVPLWLYSKQWQQGQHLNTFKGFHSVAKLILRSLDLEKHIPQNTPLSTAPDIYAKLYP